MSKINNSDIDNIGREISAQGIPLFGVISYAQVKDHTLNCRAKGRLNNNLNSVIMVALPYKLDYRQRNLSFYACVDDYHTVLGEKLRRICDKLSVTYEDEQFMYFVDNSPIPEVSAAAAAGIGVVGKNRLLITQRYGSYVFLGSILTTMELPTNAVDNGSCSLCDKCKMHCPTGCLDEDNKKCLSAITQQKGELSDDEIALIKSTGIIWGCDCCQSICPLNSKAENTEIKEFISSQTPFYTSENFDNKKAYAWRGKAVIDRNLKAIIPNSV